MASDSTRESSFTSSSADTSAAASSRMADASQVRLLNEFKNKLNTKVNY